MIAYFLLSLTVTNSLIFPTIQKDTGRGCLPSSYNEHQDYDEIMLGIKMDDVIETTSKIEKEPEDTFFTDVDKKIEECVSSQKEGEEDLFSCEFEAYEMMILHNKKYQNMWSDFYSDYEI